MVNKLRLTRESSEDIGFVKSCLIIGAIDRNEFKEWVFFIIKNNSVDDIPLYIFDLIDFNDYFCNLFEVIGFVLDSGLTDDEDNALYGIAVKRFGSFFDMPISEKRALKALSENPQVLDRFKQTFPFIYLDF